ncbi:protein phosphatase 1 regulatory subunit 12B-like isoform X6 [Penaeus japonicus]|uniref:protein phosphatase 1 regulatory subunit 12B-like isoform X6 n=1 Tax=Penaeus japonicus TaxID=27405 RepID=UPI001C70E847|nr:protein phosphatase 1 regulatory subunit 12B-like isoform X6 [Penaeus japonicus]
MAVDNRSASALFKRAEQLRRWQESETNKTEIIDNSRPRKVNFSDGCIFLAACAAGDKQEVLRLLEKGADIDTANVDGLTALHAACIDDNLDMVEFLVDQGADVNRGDMEGWTALHATASCGFNSIAKFLIDRGADLSLVNNDGDLAIDIADSDEMESLLQREIDTRGIDCDASRNEEERRMLEDAQMWLGAGYLADRPHPKTGATALHVASAKGYIKVMSLLLEAGSDINAQDLDGWTPLHAAAHWGQREAVEILAENMADMDVRNFVGQSAFDVADNSLLRLMDELKRKQVSMKVNQSKQTPRKRKTSPHRDHSNKKEREDQRESDGTSGDESSSDVDDEESSEDTSSSDSSDSSESESDSDDDDDEEDEDDEDNDETRDLLKDRGNNSISSYRVLSPVGYLVEKKNKVNKENATPQIIPTSVLSEKNSSRSLPQARADSTMDESEVQSWRRPSSLRNKTIPDDKNQKEEVSRNISTQPRPSARETEDVLPGKRVPEKDERNHVDSMARVTLPQEPNVSTSSVVTTNASPPARTIGRSFVPPSRDEESETQRKAHAKMVRSTRRSTQGVTLEDIKSAEQLMKNKQQQQLQQQASTSSPESKESPSSTLTVSTPTTQGTPTTTPSSPSSKPKPESPTKPEEEERRPSWRLKVDETDKNKFSLENVRSKDKPEVENDAESVTVPLRKKNSEEKADEDKDSERISQTREGTQAAIQRRKKPKRRSTGRVQVNMDEIDPEKRAQRLAEQQQQPGDEGSEEEEEEKDSVSVGLCRPDEVTCRCTFPLVSDDLADAVPGTESVSERGEASKGSTTSLGSTINSRPSSRATSLGPENGDIDYKKLYEEQLEENFRVHERLRDTESELRQTREAIDLNNKKNNTRLAMAEADKREKRALERKLSEMEEELKQLQKLKAENEKLKAENRALTRVVSKLTNSATSGMGNLATLSK